MKNFRLIISVILFLVLVMSTVFNILFLFGRIDKELLYTGFFILLLAVAAVSMIGIIYKNIRKEERVSINLVTPVKDFGRLYIYIAIAWGVTYFFTIIFK